MWYVSSMTAITATEARRNLFGLIQQVNDDCEAVEILSKRGDAVLISASEYRALQETAHLLRVPANAKRLAESLAELAAGRGRERELSWPVD
jgi:antitoxin YefM